MLQKRIIPTLLLKDEGLVKTTQFRNPRYIGDPVNTIKIFNELEVDELILLDIEASKQKVVPNIKLIQQVATECFMPLAYGGGIVSLDQVKAIFDAGVEKIVINSSALIDPNLITKISKRFGAQAVIVSIDVVKNFWGKYRVSVPASYKIKNLSPVRWAGLVQDYGAGEIFLTAVDREGTWKGYDVSLISAVANSVSIPVIANGGAGSMDDVYQLLDLTAVSGAAIGNLVVYQKKGMGVLVNVPKAKNT